MATPLEDVGKQVGRSRPPPVAAKGLPRASHHLLLLASPPGVAGVPAPGGLHPIPTGTLPGTHGAGAGGGHRAHQHRRGHRGTDRLLYRYDTVHALGPLSVSTLVRESSTSK